MCVCTRVRVVCVVSPYPLRQWFRLKLCMYVCACVRVCDCVCAHTGTEAMGVMPLDSLKYATESGFSTNHLRFLRW